MQRVPGVRRAGHYCQDFRIFIYKHLNIVRIRKLLNAGSIHIKFAVVEGNGWFVYMCEKLSPHDLEPIEVKALSKINDFFEIGRASCRE